MVEKFIDRNLKCETVEELLLPWGEMWDEVLELGWNCNWGWELPLNIVPVHLPGVGICGDINRESRGWDYRALA